MLIKYDIIHLLIHNLILLMFLSIFHILLLTYQFVLTYPHVILDVLYDNHHMQDKNKPVIHHHVETHHY